MSLDMLIPRSQDDHGPQWATVTATGPLRITLDGPDDEPELPFTLDTLVSGLAVNDRVLVLRVGRRRVIIGKAQ